MGGGWGHTRTSQWERKGKHGGEEKNVILLTSDDAYIELLLFSHVGFTVASAMLDLQWRQEMRHFAMELIYFFLLMISPLNHVNVSCSQRGIFLLVQQISPKIKILSHSVIINLPNSISLKLVQ